MHCLSTTLLAATIIPLGAAEMIVSDLRLGLGVLSNEYDGASSTTVTTGGGSVSSSSSSEEGRDSDDNFRTQLQYVAGHLGEGGGFIWGLGIAVNHARWDNGEQDAHVTTPLVNILLGYGYAFTSSWHFEIAPFAGVGGAFYSVTDGGETETSEECDAYVEYGVKIGTYYTFANDLQIGIEVPYLVGKFDPDYDYVSEGDDRVTVADERENNGFGVLLTIGGRF